MSSIQTQCQKAHAVSHELGLLSSDIKNKALEKMAHKVLEHQAHILSENQKDIENGKNTGMSEALIDRLSLSRERLRDISDALLDIKNLKDPIGDILETHQRPNGLKIDKVRVPLGVIGMIYEARPNVTADAAGLCIKTGNCVVLRGSSTAKHSNLAIATALKEALSKSGISSDAIQLLEDTSREGVSTFVTMKDYLNLIIPRGGASLIQSVVKTATVPTIETGVGNCHTYVHEDADLETAWNVTLNAKVQRPSVCCATESLLVDEKIAPDFLPKMVSLLKEKGVECRGCKATRNIVPEISEANDDDWDTEYLDLILAIRTVKNCDEALAHIRAHGTNHSEAIISKNQEAIVRFSKSVDAAAVLSNTSTRFVDGGQFGFGAEIGISTQKLHARGPMALPEMTSYKYVVTGAGQIRT